MAESANRFLLNINDYNPYPFCIIYVDLDADEKPADWHFAYCNDALAALYGLPKEAFLHHGFFELFPDGDRGRLPHYYRAAYEGKSEAFDSIDEEKDQYIYIEVFPIGQPGYCACALRDIRKQVFEERARHRALQELVQSLEAEKSFNKQVRLYATAMGVEYPFAIDVDFSSNHYHLMEKAPDMEIQVQSEGALDELLETQAKLVPDEEQAVEFRSIFSRTAIMDSFREGRTEIAHRYQTRNTDGSIHWILTKVICTECKDEDIHGICLSKFIDQEMQNEQLRIEAEKANLAKSSFLLRMSHDIRTPLNGIMGMLDIAGRYPRDIEVREDCRKKVKESAQTLLELINEVLDMNKLQSGNVVLENTPFDLAEICRNVSAMVSRQAESRGIQIIEEDCAVRHKRLIGSPLHFKRIMTNILSNAIKYNRENGKIYVTCREVCTEGNTAYIQFKCRDTGLGMSPEFLEHIFEPFSQEDSSPRSEYGGTGLGMSITKTLVDKMKGSITVKSVKNEGSVFDVVIPFAINREEETEPVSAGEAESISLDGLNILLAEDNEMNREVANFLLRDSGANVVNVKNGQEAVETFSQSAAYAFDIILMDVMMPVMDGYEATREIRKLDRPDANIPIIAVTASAFAEDRIAAREAGMNEHLSKPLESRQLSGRIIKCVEAYRRERSRPDL